MKRKRIITSFILAIILSIFCYAVENIPFSIGTNNTVFFFLENKICSIWGPDETCEDVFFINIGYEKAVAEYKDIYGSERGTVAITDRDALDKLLSRLQRTDSYSQIFLDVRFEEGIHTDSDSSLFYRIASMRDITIATHRDITITDSVLLSQKAALADYYYTADNPGFSRYQFLQDGKESVPLKMYRDSVGRTIKRLWKLPVYHDGKHLCKNSLFLKIHKDLSVKQQGINPINYYDLGFDVNQFLSDADLSYLTNRKFVFIGDFVSDKHGTYFGEQPGVYLVYLSMKALLEKRHWVSWIYVFFIFVLYFLLTFWILSGQKITNKLKIKNKAIRFLASLIGYSFVLTSFSFFMYLFTHSIYNIFFPSLFFSVLTLIKSYSES